MISGAFLLQKDIAIGVLFRKYVWHLAVLQLGWNLIYNMVKHQGLPSGSVGTFSYFLCPGDYHLWFLYMLIGVYIAQPLVKKIVDGGLSTYLLCLWFVTSVLLSGLRSRLFAGTSLSFLGENVLVFPFSVSFVGYFVLGHYLYSEVALSQKARRWIYALGLMGLMGGIVGTHVLSSYRGSVQMFFYSYHNIMVLLVAVALFVWCRYTDFTGPFHLRNRRVAGFVRACSDLTLGVYLIHVLVLENIYPAVYRQGVGSVVAIPLIWLSTVLLSFALSWLLRKIPVIGALVK